MSDGEPRATGSPEGVATFRVRTKARVLGIAVLSLAGVAAVVLVGEDASPWSWLLVGVVGLAAAVATVANFGDRFEVEPEGITYRNALTAIVGFPQVRRAAWSDVAEAIEQDGTSFFLVVEGQSRWVLDQLDGHEELRVLLGEHGVPILARNRPRLTRWGAGDGPGRGPA